MGDVRPISKWQPLVGGIVFAAAALGVVAPLLWTESATTRGIVGSFVCICAGLFAYGTIHDWLGDRRLRQVLAGRETLDPESFGKQFFSDIPGGREVATAVRRLLDEHMKRDLGGLRPDDALSLLQDWLDPLFLDDIAQRLGFKPPQTWPEFRDLVEPLKTVRDLVVALAGRMRG